MGKGRACIHCLRRGGDARHRLDERGVQGAAQFYLLHTWEDGIQPALAVCPLADPSSFPCGKRQATLTLGSSRPTCASTEHTDFSNILIFQPCMMSFFRHESLVESRHRP